MLVSVEMLRGATELLLLDKNPYVLTVSAHSWSVIRRFISFFRFYDSKIAVVLHPSLGFNYPLLPWQLSSIVLLVPPCTNIDTHHLVRN